jgi:hypothetical protein
MVLQQCGETGLRIKGQIYSETESRASALAGKGLVKILTPAMVKEEKQVFETKELKPKKK